MDPDKPPDFQQVEAVVRDPERVAALESYGLLDTAPEEDYECVTRLLRHLLDVPIALVSLVHVERQWFKAHLGVEAEQTSCRDSFCKFAMAARQPMVIDDALRYSWFKDNPLVTGSPGIRFYAGVPLINQEGHALGSLCVIDTQPRELAKEQLEMLTCLARQVVTLLELRRSVKRLSQQKVELEAAQAAARAESQNTRQVLANISHEIRTPINGVCGITSLLERTDMDAQQREWLGMIRDSSKMLLCIINDVLDMSKIQAGQLHLAKEPFNPRSCIGTCVNAVQVIARDKRVELSTHFAADTPIWFLGDGDRLKQILLNLLNNALKFTENGTIKVHLGARALDEAGDGDSAHAQRWRLDFSVTDSGVGIEPDVLETLFQPFQQGKNAVSRKNGGTGLGLTICRQLCHLMGGDIWAESTPGEGATFSFYLVCDPDTKSLSSGQGNQGTLAGFENLAQRFPLRIMLVDDAPINRHLMKSVLQRLGYAPVICENGAEAVAAAEQQDFDLIFMDIRMPEMSGIEASRAIREGIGQRPPEERHLPFIAALTADAMKQDIDSCFEAGMNCYLTKPFMPEDAERFIKHNWERITQQVMAPEPMDWMV